MERCRALEQKHGHKTMAREALLAATTIHLAPGDLLCGAANDLTAVELAPLRRNGSIPEEAPLPKFARWPLAAAMARGLKVAGAEGVVLAYTQAGLPEEGWAEALAWAQTERLPIVFACADATGGKPAAKKAAAVTWASVAPVAKKLRFPVLTVDGEDAVALYRGMQESVLRARNSIGPALIWAVLSPAKTKLTRSQMPLTRLKKYLAARNIPLPR